MPLVFDDCVIDLNRRELVRDATVVSTTPMVFDLLAYLIENRERVVSRDDLIDGVWNGRIVSESTLNSHINAVRKAVGDSGKKQLVIRTISRKGFRFVSEVKEICSAESFDPSSIDVLAPVQTPPTNPALTTLPSIAVLPFVNLSGDPDQEYLADGVVEDIIAALSQCRWLFVVARNSSFTYKGLPIDVKAVGQALGVRYILEGSWRRAKNRVRMTSQLIDATTGAHHWAGRAEGVLDDIFKLQDQITENVVGAIVPELERAEIERARRKPTEIFDAYDYYLRGMARLHQGSRKSIDQALSHFASAVASDPNFSSAYAMSSWCYCWRKANGWMTDRSRETAEGVRLARQAVELGKGDAVALARSGHALGFLANDIQGGIDLLDRALVLNPNLAAGWFLGGFLKIWNGEPEVAIAHLEHAMRLSPLDPEVYRMQAGMALAYLFAGHFDAASSWAEKAFRNFPTLLLAAAALAASHALAHRPAEAQCAIDHLIQLDPTLRMSNLRDWLPIRRAENLATLVDGLRKAGLPE